jgi:superfamily II DNA or RNA helicase
LPKESIVPPSPPIALREGQILTGAHFPEPVRVETVTSLGSASWEIGVVGLQSERFRRVTLTDEDITRLKVTTVGPAFDADGGLVKLGLQAYALGIAYEFDPYFALSISRVDPLPHQLEAVYDYLLKLARVRFLLADDAGAGKTIMAGLLLRELKLRGLAERVLIVCPANLAFQWQRELREKFDEQFFVLRGDAIREQFGLNQWQEHNQVITSLDLAKRKDILPGLQQVHWDMVIVDEAHRMSAGSDTKTERYRLGELLRDSSDHLLLLTATPHRGDPVNFTRFLQLLDEDAFADVSSIHKAMENGRAPFYLRRTKEAMHHFPERQDDGTWVARKIFTKRIPHTADFAIDGEEYELYRSVTAYVKRQATRAAQMGDDPRARAVGFLMALYQRRLASSTYAVRQSLTNRAKRLEKALQRAHELARFAPDKLPTAEEVEEMEEADRERLEEVLDAVTLAGNADQVRTEIADLQVLAEQAKAVEEAGVEAKLAKLQVILREQGFFDKPDQRLLIFTEFRDTLEYLVARLRDWGFRVGFIHGSMKPGSREDPGTRLHSEQQFQEGGIQVLVATEAAGEGINLQVCHILFNYDIPWNPNRLEQRMGRIHRYGQEKDCLIFNFVATNTIEGRVLTKLLEKLQEIRDALDDDAVFNVIGEVLPAAHIERVLRDYYAGGFGAEDLEDRLLRDVQEDRFRAICQHALEGLASRKLNLAMLVERRARAQERRLVPETSARFIGDAAKLAGWTMKPLATVPHAFEPGPTPLLLKRYERDADWRLSTIAARYPRFSTDRGTATGHKLEWVTPGHPLFEALRRHAWREASDALTTGACLYSIDADEPARIDVYRASVADGLDQTVRTHVFAVRLASDGISLHEPTILSNLQPGARPERLPAITLEPEPRAWLHEHALAAMLDDARAERVAEVDRIEQHIELSLTELICRVDQQLWDLVQQAEKGVAGMEGLLKAAEERHAALIRRREQRRQDLARQRTLSLRGVERITSILVLPHPERNAPDVRNLRQDRQTEATAMRIVMEHERGLGRVVEDVHEKDLGYDITSRDPESGDLRLIEIKGIGAVDGGVCLTPHEKEVAEDRPDCYWLYIVTGCKTAEGPTLRPPIANPGALPWHEVRKIEHYTLGVSQILKDAGR